MTKIKLWTPDMARARQLAHDAVTISPSVAARSAREDLALFGELVLGLPPADHHKEWIDAIVTDQNSTVLSRVAGDNLRICAPRGSGKTLWISVALAWIIGHNPHIRIILVSYSEDVALSVSVAIKSIIESETYQQVFPYIRPSHRWRDRYWSINRKLAGVYGIIKDSTLAAVGMSGAIASRRSDLICIDDPIKSSKDIRNPVVRKSMVVWWSEVLLPTLVPGGRVICPATRYRVDDIHGTTFTEDNEWRVITHKAIIEDEDGEKSFWEDYMSLDFLLKKREDNPSTFSSQYQQEPQSEEAQIIKPDWIKRDRVPAKFEEIAIGVDLAASKKEEGDYSAIVVVGRRDDKYYVIGVSRGRWSLHELVKKLLVQHVYWSDYTNKLTFQIESVAYQSSFIPEFKRQSKAEGVSVRAEAATQRQGDKEQRLFGVSGLFEDGDVIFSSAIASGWLVEELVKFGFCEHDDGADALVYALQKFFVKSRRKIEGGGYS